MTPYLSLIASVILLLTALEPFSGRRAICWWRVPEQGEGGETEGDKGEERQRKTKERQRETKERRDRVRGRGETEGIVTESDRE